MVLPGGKTLTEEEHKASMEAFQALGVCAQLAEAAASLGWKTPSSIQEQAVPLVLAGKCIASRSLLLAHVVGCHSHRAIRLRLKEARTPSLHSPPPPPRFSAPAPPLPQAKT